MTAAVVCGASSVPIAALEFIDIIGETVPADGNIFVSSPVPTTDTAVEIPPETIEVPSTAVLFSLVGVVILDGRADDSGPVEAVGIGAVTFPAFD